MKMPLKRRAVTSAGVFIVLVWINLWIPSVATALSFDEVVAHIDTIPSVRAAQLDRIAAEQRLALVLFPGDAELTITPAAAFETTEGATFSEATTISTATLLNIPVGLSRERRVDVEAARMALSRARVAEQHAYVSVYADLVNAYRRAWLAQRELEVLERELDAAVEFSRTVNERFERGTASLKEVNEAEDDLIGAQTALREGTLARRLRALELLYLAGLERNRTDALEPLDLILPDIPRPPELTDWASEHDPRIIAFDDDITAVALEQTALDGPIGSPTFRAGFSGWDQSASVALNTENPALSLSYNAPIATFGDLPESRGGSTDGDTWELSFAIALPLQTTRTAQMNADLLSTNEANIAARRDELERELALLIRSRYQQFALTEESIVDARRSVQITSDILTTVAERLQSERATTADLLFAEAQHQRALYRLDAALASREEAKILTAAAASYLHVLIGTIDQ